MWSPEELQAHDEAGHHAEGSELDDVVEQLKQGRGVREG